MDNRINNKGVIGNKGGRPYNAENREKAGTLKGLSLDWMLKIMRGKDEEKKKEIVMKIATTCLPQVIEGDDGSPLVVKLINYARDNNSTQVQPKRVPTPVLKCDAEVQNCSVEQEGWEVKDGAE